MSFQTFVTQRLAAITAAINAIATNAKKIDELPIQTILYPASKIHVSKDGISESLEVQKIIDGINSGIFDTILSIGEITLIENVVTVPAGARWLISNINYSNVLDVQRTVPYSATGLIRKDILVANTSNDIVLIRGQESASISIRPNIPPNTILVTEINVTETTIATPINPVLGGPFVRKSERYFIDVNAPGLNSINLFGESSYIIISDVYAAFGNLEYLIDSGSSCYVGKSYILYNNQATDLNIIHNPNGTGTDRKYFIFPNNQNFILKPGEQVKFIEHEDGTLRYLGQIYSPVSATQSGIVNNILLQELGGVDKRINGIRIGRGNGNNSENLAFGFEALNANQPSSTTYEGTSNVGIGSRALKENISGHSNLAIGNQALTANTSGTYNTAIGGSALGFNTTGIENTAIGAFTLYGNISGRFNIAIGSGTLQRNISGSRNIAIGKGALNNNTGDRNIAVGLNSGSGITTGSGNTIIGDSGNTTTGISTGSFNAIFAPNLGAVTGITTGSGNVVIGKVTGLDADSQNTVIIANGVGEIRFRVNTAGLVIIPSQTVDLITADASGKAVVTKEYINLAVKPYKVYVALLTQAGSNAPVATVLENTLGGTIAWTRNTHGNYTGTLANAFTLEKTVGFIQSNNPNRSLSFSANNNADSFEISTNGADDILINATIEVRVYN